jgi:hypothetical protein
MTYISRPRPSYLDTLERISWNGEPRWRDPHGNIYTYDGLHGEVEVFNRRGKHIAVVDIDNGRRIKPAVAGRKIDV